MFGNEGLGLGPKFARSLHKSLNTVLSDFGESDISRGRHLEKLCLIEGGVGRDNVSDFTTNLIKDWLLKYTQTFALEHLGKGQRAEFAVPRARFNYETEHWDTVRYELPLVRDDYVILTPNDMLTRDDTWISHADMIGRFSRIPAALPDAQLRAEVSNYFSKRLGRESSAKAKREAAQATVLQFPTLIDHYIKIKEDEGEQAEAQSAERVDNAHGLFVEQIRRVLADVEARTDFYEKPWTSYDEALDRVGVFKHYVENQDGYKLLNRNGRPLSNEEDVQIFFGLVWCKSDFDGNREVNNGRGPVDFKVSFGSKDKSLIEFKLASNTQLKRNLEKQVPIYEAANRTNLSVKVIVIYNAAQQRKVNRILKQLKLDREEGIVLIDARNDNKPSASKA